MSDRPLPLPLGDAFAHEELAPGLELVERRLVRRRHARRAALATTVLAAAAIATWLALGPGVPAHDRLTLAGGRALAVVAGETARLSDGSTITLDARGALDTIASTPTSVVLRLRRGRARFDVEPNGPRSWSIDAGPLRVRVVGTAFTIERTGDWASVTVHHGVVEITSRHETRRLYGGEHFESGPRPQLARTQPRRAPSLPPEQTATPPSPSPTRRGARPPDEPRPRIPAGSPAPEAPSLETLLDQADAARREGRIDDATTALWTIVDTHPRSAEAPSAAVTAGHLERQRRRFDAAVVAYVRALELGPPPALAEVCYEHLIRCHLALGDRDRAERAAAEYRLAFPGGSRARAVEELLRAP